MISYRKKGGKNDELFICHLLLYRKFLVSFRKFKEGNRNAMRMESIGCSQVPAKDTSNQTAVTDKNFNEPRAD